MRNSLRTALVVACTAVVLAACGGDGGDGGQAGTPPATNPPATNPPVQTTSTLTGTAATGRPFAGALVTVYDATCSSVGSTNVAPDGSYSVTIPASTKAPLVLEATLDNVTLVSAVAETRDARANITPLTSLIAARLAPNGNPTSLKQDSSAVTTASLASKVTELQAALRPLLASLGVDTDPLTGVFTADGTGHDRVLDALDVQILPAGPISNIEITVRGSAAGINTIFTSSAATIDPLPTVEATSLPPVGINSLVDDLLRRWTACYALPLQARVSGATANTGNVVGTAADVIAPECRSLFVDDDPATYLSNGARVGRDAANNGAFAGLFRSGATGAVFDQGEFEFLRANAEKDVVFSYRTTGAGSTDSTFDQIVARNVNGVLKFVGNGYIYSARVRPAFEVRDFLNQPAANYINTGYDLFAANQLDGAGNSIFSKVVVTAPTGQVLTLRPSAGRSFMTLERLDGSISASPIIYLAARFTNPATSGNPATFDTGLLFASPQFTEADLSKIPGMGVWSLEFFHVDTSKANVVQAYRTVARAPTLSEIEARPIASFTPAAQTFLVNNSNQQFGVVLFGPPSATAPNVFDVGGRLATDFWTVPAGATAPSIVQNFGTGPDPDGAGPLGRPAFNDALNVSPNARRADITCSQQGAGDTHCDSTTGVTQYALNAAVSSVQVLGFSRKQEEVSRLAALFFILPR